MACKVFHDADQRTPELSIGYAMECRDQLQRVAIFKDVEQAGRLKAGLARSRGCAGIVEKRYGHLENVADPPQPARADAVRPLFVFLNLLEGDPEFSPELLLRKLAFDAARADAAPHLYVPSFDLP